MYKTVTITFLMLLSITFFSCKKLTQFEIEYDQTVVIPSSSGLNLPLNIFSPEVETDAESKFRVNDTRKDLIREILLQELTLTITSPQNGNFDILKSITIYINADGLSEKKIAWKEDIPQNASSVLELETINEDLQEYIKKDEFSIRVNTINRQFIDQNHTVNVNSVFWVDAKLI
ncbi:MAG: hypothetical protein EA412_14280 [Chitinophagaceae bacterium]|nr:MAG: hypothetical protein EA412_14280 [Chitinophagaceae bacterium]